MFAEPHMSSLPDLQKAFAQAGISELTADEWTRVFRSLGMSPDKEESYRMYLQEFGTTTEPIPVSAVLQRVNAKECIQRVTTGFCASDPDKDVKAFLHLMGVQNPSQQDIEYVRKSYIMEIASMFTQTVVKMKPYVENINGLNKFGADYFNRTLAAQKRLVLVSSAIDGLDTFMEAVRHVGSMGAPIIAEIYDFQSSPCDVQNHVQELVKKHGVFKTVAFCSCSGDDVKEGKWQLVAHKGLCFATGKLDEGINELFQTLADAASVRLDLIACSLASSEAGMKHLNDLKRETKTTIAASSDILGNAIVGGNWVLETDGIDLVDVYFDHGKIENWNGTFGTRPRHNMCSVADPNKVRVSVSTSGPGSLTKALSGLGQATDWNDPAERWFAETAAQQTVPQMSPSYGVRSHEYHTGGRYR